LTSPASWNIVSDEVGMEIQANPNGPRAEKEVLSRNAACRNQFNDLANKDLPAFGNELKGKNTPALTKATSN